MNVWQRLRPALVRLGGGGLALRFVALSLVLLLAVQAAGLAVVDRSIDRQARNQLDGELRVGERVWLRLLDTQAQRLRQGAALLSSDYGFRTAAASGDAETIASALRNHGARIGASVAGLLDTEFAPRALHTGGAAMAPQAVHDIVEALVRDGSASRIALVDGHPHQFVAVPMRAPLTIGWVVMGFPLGDAVVQDMHALSGLHVTLLAVPDGGPARLAGTTLDAAAAEALRQRGSGFEGALDLAGQAAYGHAMQQDVAGGALHAVLLRSIDEVAAPLHELQRVLAMLTLVGVLLFGLGSAWMARRLTTPLRALARASEELGRGDPALPTRGSERRDEIGDLARAFDQMRRDVARHQAELHELAFTDRLTGIRNRTGFHAALAQALAVAAPHRVPVGVLMLGLDRFRLVNDVLGHATGDALLRAVATRLLGDVLRHGDVVARLGGDEFALLLPGSDADATRAVAQRIARSFAQPLTLDTQAVDLSAAVGIACWPAHGGGADELLMHAEVAMYAAKRRREPALVYTPAMDPGSAATLSLLSQLRRAVEHGELRMLLQPKVALAGHRLVGAEALMRWSHPERAKAKIGRAHV